MSCNFANSGPAAEQSGIKNPPIFISNANAKSDPAIHRPQSKGCLAPYAGPILVPILVPGTAHFGARHRVFRHFWCQAPLRFWCQAPLRGPFFGARHAVIDERRPLSIRGTYGHAWFSESQLGGKTRLKKSFFGGSQSKRPDTLQSHQRCQSATIDPNMSPYSRDSTNRTSPALLGCGAGFVRPATFRSLRGDR